MATQPHPAEEAHRRKVWIAGAGDDRPTIGDLVGAARAVALTGDRRNGQLRGSCGEVVHQRSIEGASYVADPNGHAVEVTIDGILVLARWRDAAARMVHLARSGCRRLIDRHYRLTHLLQPGRVWIGNHHGADPTPALIMVDRVDGCRVHLRRVADGSPHTARIERFDGRSRGFHPADDELADLAVRLMQRHPPKP